MVKKADKGGATVVWSNDKYVTEAYRQLDNDAFYQSLTFNPTEDLKTELKGILLVALPFLLFLLSVNNCWKITCVMHKVGVLTDLPKL